MNFRSGTSPHRRLAFAAFHHLIDVFTDFGRVCIHVPSMLLRIGHTLVHGISDGQCRVVRALFGRCLRTKGLTRHGSHF